MPTMPCWPTPTIHAFKLLLVLALCGCPAPPVTPDPPQPTASPLGARFVLRVINLNGSAVPTARLRLSHPLQATQSITLNSAGEADLSALSSGLNYLLEISADRHLPLQRWLQIPAQAQQRQTVVLQPALAPLQGQVLSDRGQPLDQAVVQRGDLRVLTDTDGRFSLPQSPDTTGPLEIAKQGHFTWTGPPGGASYSLRTLPDTPRLRTHALNWPHTQLLAASQTAGYSLLPWSEAPLDPSRDLLWLVCPQGLDTAQLQAVQDFVRAGGKLVLNTEWAGLADYDADVARELLSPWGLEPGGDSLHHTDSSTDNSTLSISRFAPHALTSGLQELRLYHSGSVRSLRADQGQLLASSDSGVFRIQASGGDSVLAAALGGLGKVVALGDASLWLDSDSDGDGVSNFATADHARLWQQVLSW